METTSKEPRETDARRRTITERALLVLLVPWIVGSVVWGGSATGWDDAHWTLLAIVAAGYYALLPVSLVAMICFGLDEWRAKRWGSQQARELDDRLWREKRAREERWRTIVAQRSRRP